MPLQTFALLRCQMLDAVDDEDVDWTSLWNKFQSAALATNRSRLLSRDPGQQLHEVIQLILIEMSDSRGLACAEVWQHLVDQLNAASG